MKHHLRRAYERWVVLGRPLIVRLHPGDVIVLTVAGPLTVAAATELTRRIEDSFGYRHEVLIIDSGSTLAVLSDTEGPGR